jgi:hypothetical protein
MIMLSIAGVNLSPALAQQSRVTLSAWAPRESTIDGKINDDEWAAAAKADVDTLYGRSTVYIMNDAKNLYIAVMVRDKNLGNTIGRYDQVVVDLHAPDDNGQFKTGDDSVGCQPPRTFDDAFVTSDGSFLSDRSIDGECVVTRIGDFNHFELRHPFNSGDQQDIALKLGDGAAFRIVIFDDGKVADVFPKTTDARNPNTDKWGSIRIASAPAALLSNPLLLVGAVVVVVGWVGWLAYMFRERGKKAKQAQEPASSSGT